ncbi:hypothetical protein FQR65_LT11809 [Abscondita terminalis]|nr:hypothetical protein FQR65_LT11809 [Abscondita terminalis]
MERLTIKEDSVESLEEANQIKIQENLANWQLGDNPLTEISEAQVDLLYEVKDLTENQYYGSKNEENTSDQSLIPTNNIDGMPVINTTEDYIKWMIDTEKRITKENVLEFIAFYRKLEKQSSECKALLKDTEKTVTAVEYLHQQSQDVTAKTDTLHNLSEQLMKQQKVLKDKKVCLKDHLHWFEMHRTLLNNMYEHSGNVSSNTFMETLDQIDECIKYLKSHLNFKEAKSYLIKYENILMKAVIFIKMYFTDYIRYATMQVTNPDNKTNLLIPVEDEISQEESSFSLYYGKFHSISVKVKPIIQHVESKIEKHNAYEQLLGLCQQIYFSLRSPVMTDAVAKALSDLKNKHKSDYSILFRSAGLFIMQVCQDESTCFHYFFTNHSEQLHEYFGILCQHLYDMLRPCLIGIYHLEVLTELCGILRSEMLNDQIQNNNVLTKFKEVILQLLEDVEERLVFRTNIFFHNDLKSYRPSPRDLAYPEKLERMEIIMKEMAKRRTECQSSVVSVDSQEVATINAGHVGQFRSYTGNSPADLHGMYPTVKRTLVCLSRLYCCLDREIFQGLAQEALAICVETIAKAEDQISVRKVRLSELIQCSKLIDTF